MKLKELLPAVRRLMKQHDLAAYYVPSTDPHNCEYTPDCFMRVAALSGFTGSAGTVIVTLEEALLWTDGRYFVQADKELNDDWKLMKLSVPGFPTVSKWCSDLPEGTRFGYDPYVMTVTQYETLSKAAEKLALTPVEGNLVDPCWTTRPATPNSTIFELEPNFSGKLASEKVKDVVENLEKTKADAVIFSALDDIAWLLNLRGADIECTPVFLSYVIVTKTGGVHLFTDLSRLPAEPRKAIAQFTTFHEYDSLLQKLPDLCKGKVLFDERNTSMAVHNSLKEHCRPVHDQSSVSIAKACKNKVEGEGFVSCHVRDGVALASYLQWLENEMQAGKKITESSGANKLEWFRSQQDHFVSLSFPSISSSGPNAAIIHYRPETESCRTLTKDEMYLIDSGGQYKDGTTDVTRTVCFGTPKPKEIEAFTLVLKGVIALNTAVFPAETTGNRLDTLARQSLWKYGLDYMHGTGHGVGHFLGVHEGPIGIGTRPSPIAKPLKEGNVVSNEPGFYLEGEMGIRIENLEIVRKAETKYKFSNIQYYTMETLTMCPIEAKLVDVSLLTPDEVQWFDNYHKKVLSTLSAATTDASLKKWLAVKCAPLRTTQDNKKRKHA
eukprot:TRINITY_DN2101_c0_g4_i1.p1 TRINITY_DN2101_c0_g4~~TRINITY_DN2101_c0_g4_i1.p1  ORF type:complete len:621 (+),score=159.18 TRINITY_DN2101_c0_g4_i1:42-1865(+)